MGKIVPAFRINSKNGRCTLGDGFLELNNPSHHPVVLKICLRMLAINTKIRSMRGMRKGQQFNNVIKYHK